MNLVSREYSVSRKYLVHENVFEVMKDFEPNKSGSRDAHDSHVKTTVRFLNTRLLRNTCMAVFLAHHVTLVTK